MFEFQEIEGKPDDDTIEKLEEFYASIFGSEHLGKFAKRIFAADNPLTVLALDENRIAGFKVGYRIAPKTFYSWVGGVAQDFRQNGIAAELMRRQHEWCRRNGFEIIRTKTMNRFKPMLILNLKNGFDITEAYKDAEGVLKIVLEKNLRN